MTLEDTVRILEHLAKKGRYLTGQARELTSDLLAQRSLGGRRCGTLASMRDVGLEALERLADDLQDEVVAYAETYMRLALEPSPESLERWCQRLAGDMTGALDAMILGWREMDKDARAGAFHAVLKTARPEGAWERIQALHVLRLVQGMFSHPEDPSNLAKTELARLRDELGRAREKLEPLGRAA